MSVTRSWDSYRIRKHCAKSIILKVSILTCALRFLPCDCTKPPDDHWQPPMGRWRERLWKRRKASVAPCALAGSSGCPWTTWAPWRPRLACGLRTWGSGRGGSRRRSRGTGIRRSTFSEGECMVIEVQYVLYGQWDSKYLFSQLWSSLICRRTYCTWWFALLCFVECEM